MKAFEKGDLVFLKKYEQGNAPLGSVGIVLDVVPTTNPDNAFIRVDWVVPNEKQTYPVRTAHDFLDHPTEDMYEVSKYRGLITKVKVARDELRFWLTQLPTQLPKEESNDDDASGTEQEVDAPSGSGSCRS